MDSPQKIKSNLREMFDDLQREEIDMLFQIMLKHQLGYDSKMLDDITNWIYYDTHVLMSVEESYLRVLAEDFVDDHSQ